MDFKNAAELLALCEKEKCPISEIMKRREGQKNAGDYPGRACSGRCHNQPHGAVDFQHAHGISDGPGKRVVRKKNARFQKL